MSSSPPTPSYVLRCGALGRLRHPLGTPASTFAPARLRAASARAAASADEPVGVLAGERLGEGVEPVAVEERRVGVTGEERRMAEHTHEQVAIGDDAVDARPLRATRRAPGRPQRGSGRS